MIALAVEPAQETAAAPADFALPRVASKPGEFDARRADAEQSRLNIVRLAPGQPSQIDERLDRDFLLAGRDRAVAAKSGPRGRAPSC